jgi:hypothetical protein
MKASFLPRPVRNIKPQPTPVGDQSHAEDSESDPESESTAFPQAPESGLAQDLAEFYRTK